MYTNPQRQLSGLLIRSRRAGFLVGLTRALRGVLVSPILVGALLAAGCGSSSSSSSSAAASRSSSAAPSTAATVDIATKSLGKLGTILGAGRKQLTVYLFEADKGASSSCSGACASVWPPVTGTPAAAAGVNASELGTIKRADGSTQVTYNGHPLYYFSNDKASGEATGQGINGFGALWWVLTPAGSAVTASTHTASAGASTWNSGGGD